MGLTVPLLKATFIQSTRMHGCIHSKGLTEYSQIRTHIPEFQSVVLAVLHHLVLAELASSRTRVNFSQIVFINFLCFKDTAIFVRTCVNVVNTSNAEATFTLSARMQNLRKPSKPCHVGIHWITLAEYSQMSTHMLGFRWFFLHFWHNFVLAKLDTSSIRVNSVLIMKCFYLFGYSLFSGRKKG